jgi:hypothetical protein
MSLENLHKLARKYEMTRHSQAYMAKNAEITINIIKDYDREFEKMDEEERRRRQERIKRHLFIVSEELCAQFPQLARSHHDFLTIVVEEMKTGKMNMEAVKNFTTLLTNLLHSTKYIFFYADTEPEWFTHLTALEFTDILKETMVYAYKLPLTGEKG